MDLGAVDFLDNIIKDLVWIEKMTKEITESVELGKKGLGKRIQARCSELDALIGAELEDGIRKASADCDRETDKMVADIKRETRDNLSRIKAGFYAHKEEWADEIFNEIIHARAGN